MPAPIVLVHDDPSFTREVATAFNAAGLTTATFQDPLAAMVLLDQPRELNLLITRIQFAADKPHGIALARMLRNKTRGIRILFVDDPETKEHAEGLGIFLPSPITIAELITAAQTQLEAAKAIPAG